MKLDFCYDMQVQFSEAVTEHHYALMCLPQDSRRQRVSQQLLTLEPDTPLDIEEDFLKIEGLPTFMDRMIKFKRCPFLKIN